MGKNRFAFIDGLKFIASMCIALLVHYYDHFMPHLNLVDPFANNIVFRFISRYGNGLADLFFLISGLLFVVAYEKKLISKELSWGKILYGRIIRIFPLLIVSSVITYILNVIMYYNNRVFWSCGTVKLFDLVTDILCGGKTITGGGFKLNGPIWYVGVLMFMYIIALCAIELKKHFDTNLFFFIPIVIGFRWYFVSDYALCWDSHIARGFISFFLGTFLARLLLTFDYLPKKICRILRCVSILFILCFGIILLSGYKSVLIRKEHYYPLFSFFVYFPLFVLLYSQRRMAVIFDNACVKYLGGLSYHIYLWNFPIFLIIHLLVISGIYRGPLGSFSFFFGIAIVHIVVAIISHALIDKKLYPKLMATNKSLYSEVFDAKSTHSSKTEI